MKRLACGSVPNARFGIWCHEHCVGLESDDEDDFAFICTECDFFSFVP